ncbi:MAG TPA: NAD(P)/FAD-dependent oxidoreductase [Solirubrobacteraceae bacterium]|nr:NAD(P)/FAD-dependent oxidoreductase [Solirubrobacteraceae bacterium]
MAQHDAIVVGSGVNGLACAALLAKAGWDVCVLERNDWLGGAIRTAEITQPGFAHDVFSAWHPLWVGGPAHPQLAADLARHGLEYRNTDLPSATAFPDGDSAFLLRGAEENARELGPEWHDALARFLPNADLAFGVLGTELWSRAGAALAWRAIRRLGREGARDFAGELLVSARDWLETTFASPKAHGLLAPWVLHTGLGPDAAASGYMAQVIAVAIQDGGLPIPVGGGARLADALVAYVREQGGTCRTRADVVGVFSGGVRLADGEVVAARRAVVCNVTPTALYGGLLEGAPAAPTQRPFRYGRAEMQIHFALSEPPRWAGDERLGRTAIVHLTPGLDGVSRAVNEADRGLLPAEATIVVGQPLTIDPSRAPDGKGILWIQLQELPRHVKGDAAGEIDAGDGAWTEDLRERYADRIQARLARHVPNLEPSILRRVALSPADLEAANVNLVGGDPYGGSLALDQSFLWRAPHRTPAPGVWHVGASTHPGPGLGGGSGALVAEQLLRGSPLTRLLRR